MMLSYCPAPYHRSACAALARIVQYPQSLLAFRSSHKQVFTKHVVALTPVYGSDTLRTNDEGLLTEPDPLLFEVAQEGAGHPSVSNPFSASCFVYLK